MRPESIFVSYSHEDRKVVLPLIETQDDLKSSVFIDITHTPAGTNWEEYHEYKICYADRSILCWSRNASMSSEVEREWRLAFNANVRIIPVLLDSTPLPAELKHIHAISLREELKDSTNPIFPLPYAKEFSKSGDVIGSGLLLFGIGVFSSFMLTSRSGGWIAFLNPAEFWLLAICACSILLGARLLWKSLKWKKLREKVTRAVIDELKNWERES
jgi:hypothetical protein